MSEQITKDLGGITAYAAAVAAGYTGTKAQFETLMASYATVAQNAAASATAAANSKSDAEAFAKGTRNGTPVSSGDAAYENNSKYYAEQAEGYAESLDPDTLARIDGYYDEMSVGSAEQLISNIAEYDSDPYLYRTSGGSIDIGDREEFELVGGDVVWNQLVQNGNFVDTTGWNAGQGTISASNNKLTFTATSQNSYQMVSCNATIKSGHKYLYSLDITLSEAQAAAVGDGSSVIGATSLSENTKTRLCGAFAENADRTSFVIYFGRNGGLSVNKTAIAENVQLIDLTQMLGTTTADYIYSLEQATAGAGVAFFQKYFSIGSGYKAYNAGELVSVNPTGHKTVGFNQWDEEWANRGYNTTTGEYYNDNSLVGCKNYIPILPNTSYCIGKSLIGSDNTVGIFVLYYDADKNFLVGQNATIYTNWGDANFVKTTPSNAHYMRFFLTATYGTTYNNDICINLHWDGERDGDYEQYEEHYYPIDPSELHGVFKLVNGQLVADGDIRKADGSTQRRFAKVDLGTLNWNYTPSTHTFRLEDNIGAVLPNASTVANLLCVPYTTVAQDDTANRDKVISGLNWRYGVQIIDSSYSSAADFKAAMSGRYLMYEKATLTTEQLTPFTSPQKVSDWGTEEFTYASGDIPVPVGHNTKYQANLKAKLEMSPDSPNGNGEYVVTQSNGQNSYTALSGSPTIANIIARLEALENAEGGE